MANLSQYSLRAHTDTSVSPVLLQKVVQSTSEALRREGQKWVAPTTLAQLLELLQAAIGGKSQLPDQAELRLVAGNTGPGVYKDWPSSKNFLVDVSRVKELRVLQWTQVQLDWELGHLAAQHSASAMFPWLCSILCPRYPLHLLC